MFESNWMTASEKNQTSRWLQFLVQGLRGPDSASVQGPLCFCECSSPWGTGRGGRAITLWWGGHSLGERAGPLVLRGLWQPIRANAKLIYFSSQLHLYLSPGLSLQGPEFFKCLVERRLKKNNIVNDTPFSSFGRWRGWGWGSQESGPFQHPLGSPLARDNLRISSVTAPLGDTCQCCISESNHDALLGGL